jgi:hypothetical protein
MEAEATTTVGDASECLVTTKSLKLAPLPDCEFERGLETLARLQRNMYETFGSAVGAILTFAVGYLALYEKVARNKFRVDRLDKSLGIDPFAATRLRTIAAQATALNPIQEYLPAARETLYEVTLALKQDESLVRKAIAENRLTPQSTLQEVRALRQPVNVIGTVLKGRDIRGGRQDSQVSIQAMKNLVLHLTFPQDRVLRVEELSAFQQKVEAALRETFELRNVEVGILDIDDNWKSPADACRYLETYWTLKDEADELTRQVEAQADAAVNGRAFESQDACEQARREALDDAWRPFQERRQQIHEQTEAVFTG